MAGEKLENWTQYSQLCLPCIKELGGSVARMYAWTPAYICVKCGIMHKTIAIRYVNWNPKT